MRHGVYTQNKIQRWSKSPRCHYCIVTRDYTIMHRVKKLGRAQLAFSLFKQRSRLVSKGHCMAINRVAQKEPPSLKRVGLPLIFPYIASSNAVRFS